MTADARFWDRIADKYSKKPVPDEDVWQAKLRVTKAALAPDHQVLDLGCGTGSLVLELAPHAAHVHGVDISAEMVRIARGKADAQGASNVSFHCAPVDDLPPFEAGSFDMVCAYSLLHLVEDRPALLASIRRLLKPGGTFISSTVVLAGSLVPYRPLLTVMRWLGQAPPVWVLSAAQIREEVAAAGFVDVTAPDVGAPARTAYLTARKPPAPGGPAPG